MFGHIDTWSTETIMLAGTVIQGLTLEEIGTLQLDLTLMESLGQHDGWTETQVHEGCWIIVIILSSFEEMKKLNIGKKY